MRRNIVAAALGALLCVGSTPLLASPLVFKDNPIRPVDSSRLQATEGLVVGYRLHLTKELLSPRLTVYDEISKKTTTFSLSFRTKIDGTILKCDDFNDISLSISRTDSRWLVEQTAKKNRLCKHLPPDIIPGKTRVVIIYWNYNQPAFIW